LKRRAASSTEKWRSTAKNAQAKFEEAVKASPRNSHLLRRVATFYLSNGKPDLAEPLLKQIVTLETPATLTDACWARRSLASLLGSRGDFDGRCEAMALIDQNLRSKAVSNDDKRAEVSLLVADPRPEKISEAIKAMEDLVKSADVSLDDYFTLAKLYLKKGDWTNFSQQMHSVLGAQKGELKLDHLIFYISSLLEKKELDEANNWLQTLDKNAPGLFDTVRLKAEYQFLRGNYVDAFDLATKFLDDHPVQARARGPQLLAVAHVMEQFSDRLKTAGKLAIAQKFSEKADTLFASLRSVAVVGDIHVGDFYYAAYLARQKRIRECLEILEPYGENGPPEMLEPPAVDLLRSKAADAAQLAKLESILTAASRRAKNSISLLMVLADLHAERQQYEKAIADYREVLAKDKRNYQAMNNLALNLARSKKNLEESLSLINAALAISGPMAEVLDSRAVVYIARQEPDKALEDLSLAIKNDGSAEQYFHQAWAYSLAANKAEASAAFAAAKSKGINPKSLDPREVSEYDQLKDAL
jgi:tetratricopeptide (TPR) repeat protein